jgi:glutamate-1-semialdehyde 2,1-aminomutase
MAARLMTSSDELYARACAVSPGGVHSPVRAFRGVGGTPRFMRTSRGATLIDVDGREYLDFCMAFGPLILGHGNEEVRSAAVAALNDGWSYGTAEPYSLELAEFITQRIPWVESVRFVNSGTEAVMSALRVARAATQRSKILKFEGCYHGHTDSMLLRAGSGLAEAPVPDSAGLSSDITGGTLVAPLDDIAAVERLFNQHGRDIAAIIIEPLPANHGLLPQRDEFLHALARIARAAGALLILDEVISGFRIGFQGYAGRCGLRPDLVTYGKIIGGGFPVGAYGGRRELMELVAPQGPVYQAGTLSANPLAMRAGLASLRQLADGKLYRQLDALGAALELGLSRVSDLRVQRCESIFWLCLGDHVADAPTMRHIKAFPPDAAGRFKRMFHALLECGIYLAPSAFEVGFLAASHEPRHVDQLVRAVKAAS